MPLYEYRCENCGEIMECLLVSQQDAPSSCAHCGGALRRLFSPPAIQFKGSGWYVTDYAKKNGSASPSQKEKTSTDDRGKKTPEPS